MSVINRLLNYFGLQEEEELPGREPAGELEEPEFEPRPQEPRKLAGRNNVVSIHTMKSMRMVLAEPRTYDEAQEIADHLKSRRAVVVNLQRIRRDQAMRIVDFLSGTVYALNGHISKLGPNIFLCTPDNVEISGTITELDTEDVDIPKMR